MLVPFDRTLVISYSSSIVTICLFDTVLEILALISQNFKCTSILQNFNMRNASTLYVQSAKPNLKSP